MEGDAEGRRLMSREGKGMRRGGKERRHMRRKWKGMRRGGDTCGGK